MRNLSAVFAGRNIGTLAGEFGFADAQLKWLDNIQ